METFRLWLDEDKEITGFKRLRFTKVSVPLADVLHKGIHPWQGPDGHRSLGERFAQILNNDEFKPMELATFEYCSEISCQRNRCYYTETSPFEELLERVSKSIFFVEKLTYVHLLAMAKERLRKAWSREVAYGLLSGANSGFEAIRSFLKAKDKSIKLSGYADLDRYDLGRILGLEDFESEDNLLIRKGMPLTNFRSVKFLGKVTDERGLLRLTESIRDFQVKVTANEGNWCPSVLYNCRVDRNKVQFLPSLDKNPSQRSSARTVASTWRIDDGRYCFTSDIPRVTKMIEEKGTQITFPSLDYTQPRQPQDSSAQITDSRIPRYTVGRFLSTRGSAEDMRSVLRAHTVSMTGRKEQLLEKLALLSVRLYEAKLGELREYFSTNKFIRVQAASGRACMPFPVLDGFDLVNMILTMYLIKHMRGNVILESQHKNDTFDLLSLARSLLKEEVGLEGAFIKVE